MKEKNCRLCGATLEHTFVDLGMSPLSNAYLKSENLRAKENFYPLHAFVCDKCFLVQLEEFESPEQIFSDYAYFSSYSESWLDHARQYVHSVTDRFSLDKKSFVVEIASNDGYLLQYFKEAGISVLGVEPAANVAEIARKKGIPTKVEFFGVNTASSLAKEHGMADLIAANNVIAHVPDLHDFIGGFGELLKPTGTVTVEFPHLLNLMQKNQFDTIYHEHFSYLSFGTISKAFEMHELRVYDVQELSTHGGSLRIFVCHADNKDLKNTENVANILGKERANGLTDIDTYREFSEQAKETKRQVLEFLIQAKREGKTVVGYGAAAKGNTLLNYCGIRNDFIDYVVDKSPHKQGLYLPGTHIPIKAPEAVFEDKPDYLLILPWNIKDEIVEQMSDIRQWGGKFVVPIPKTEVI
jgi:SAM-dependent methyltransferase